MRFLPILLISMLLFVAACGGEADTDATAPLPTTVAEPATAVPLETPVVDESTTLTDTTPMTGTEEMTGGEAMTDTPGMTDTMGLTNTMSVTETADMTATGIFTAPMAQTTLVDVEGNPVGDASFTETEEGVLIQVTLREFTAAADGEHGLHIHTTGACTPDFQAAGGHFNPTDAMHGMENPAGPHAGDLPNIPVDADGNAIYEATSTMITLGDGENSLFDEDGSALVLHAGADDMVTDPAGDSGDRIACGVIEMQ
jgi:Cu-Zn family superoxide dismutase